MESWRQELYSNELYHHQIKGARHGVNRFQYPEEIDPHRGLTPQGRLRWGIGKPREEQYLEPGRMKKLRKMNADAREDFSDRRSDHVAKAGTNKSRDDRFEERARQQISAYKKREDDERIRREREQEKAQAEIDRQAREEMDKIKRDSRDAARSDEEKHGTARDQLERQAEREFKEREAADQSRVRREQEASEENTRQKNRSFREREAADEDRVRREQDASEQYAKEDRARRRAELAEEADKARKKKEVDQAFENFRNRQKAKKNPEESAEEETSSKKTSEDDDDDDGTSKLKAYTPEDGDSSSGGSTTKTFKERQAERKAEREKKASEEKAEKEKKAKEERDKEIEQFGEDQKYYSAKKSADYTKLESEKAAYNLRNFANDRNMEAYKEAGSLLTTAANAFKTGGEFANKTVENGRTFVSNQTWTRKSKRQLDRMSNEEFDTLLKRMDLERRYSALTANDVLEGRHKTSQLMYDLGSVAAVTAGVAGAAAALYSLKKKIAD